MKKINKLTLEQEKLIPICRDKWIQIGLKTGESDFNTFEKNIKLAYEKANIKFPDKIIRVQSPIVGAIASSISDRILNNIPFILFSINDKNKKINITSHAVGDAVRDAVGGTVQDALRGAVGGAVGDAVGGAVGNAVRDAVEDALEDAVGNAVRGAVGGAVGDAVGGAVEDAVEDAVRGAVGGVVGGAVGDAVGDAVEDAVRSAVGDAVGDALGDAVRSAVRGAVGDAVEDAVRGAVEDAVRGAVRGAVGGAVRDAVRGALGGAVVKLITKTKLTFHNWLGGQFWVGGWYWGNAFSSYFIDYCKLEVSDDIRERFEIYKALNSSVNYIWCNKDFVMVCERPKSINLNLSGQLHSITEHSIEYPDGWGIYSFNGITISNSLFDKLINKKYTFKEWTKEKNEETKSLVLAFYEEKFGGEFVFNFLSKNLKEINTFVDKKEAKYLKNTKGMNVGVYTLFKGDINNMDIAYVRCYCPSTDRMFFLGVHPDINNAKDAIASLCQIPVKLKDSLISISRQGEMFSFNFNDYGTQLLKNKMLTKEDFLNVESLKGNEYFNKIKFEY